MLPEYDITYGLINNARAYGGQRVLGLGQQLRNGGLGTDETEAHSRLRPAFDIRQPEFGDYLICLEDGKSSKTLTRHPNQMLCMTPEQNRARWHLPGRYTMIATDYSARRSKLSSEMNRSKHP